MKGYRLARALYRGFDRCVVRALPAGLERRVRAVLLRLARGTFGDRIQAHSVGELAARSDALHSTERLPDWAAREIGALAQLEPALAALVAPDAHVEVYTIPWDKTYLGDRYAEARHQLRAGYASMVLAGVGAEADVAAWLPQAARPAAVIDVDADPALRALATAAGADYLALPAGDLDANDRAALLARLVLQLRPAEVRYARHAFLDACRARHGLAMGSVTRLAALPAAPQTG